jgi:hypothetical protein
MKIKPTFLKIGVCLGVIYFVLYHHIDRQNKITALKIAIPERLKELKAASEENMNLRYKIGQFESPENLLAVSKKEEFQQLQYPLVKELIAMKEGPMLIEDEEILKSSRHKSAISVASIR